MLCPVVAWKFFELELGTCLWRRSRRFVSPTVLHLPGRTGGPMDCTCMEGCTTSAEAFHSMELGCFSLINAYCRGEILGSWKLRLQPAQFPHRKARHGHKEEMAAAERWRRQGKMVFFLSHRHPPDFCRIFC